MFVLNEERLRKKTELVRNHEILIPGRRFWWKLSCDRYYSYV